VFAVIYRWRVSPGREEDFIRGWRLVSEAVKEEFGSLGSRLHVSDDGLYISYGRWRAPEDRIPYRNHLDFHAEGWRLMQGAILEELPEIRMQIIGDILDETADSLPAMRGMA
jgi:heme-degrading monooxygenase HmoA